jgi:TonB-dependent receptor
MSIRTILLLGTAIGAAGAAHAASPAQPAAPQSTTGSDIVVTGTREQATTLKKDAAVVLDARSADEIRSLPDVNAAEALQRIPGVQMESDSGEGRFINIRGLDADLNAASYDGVRLTASNPASPQGGGRAVAFDAFPAGLLGGLEVIKTLTPAMDADGLGGVVNILPRSMAAGQTTMVDGTLGVGYEALSKQPRYVGSITSGVTSKDGKLTLIGSYAYDEDQRAIDDVEADYANDPNSTPPGIDGYVASKAYADLQPRKYQYHRTRQGFSGSLIYQPSDQTTFYIRGLRAGYTEYASKHEFQLNGLGDYTLDDAGNVISRNITSVATNGDISVDNASLKEVAISTKEEVRNELIEAGGRTTLGNGVKLDFRGAYTIGLDRFPYSIFSSWTDPNPVSLVYNDTANPNVPTYRTTDGTNPADPTIYATFSGNNRPSYTSDRETSGVVNLSIPVGFGTDGTIKAGASARAQRRLVHNYSAKLIDPGQSYGAYSGFGDTVFYGGAYNIGPLPDYSRIQNISQTAVTEDTGAYERDNENIYGGYIQYSGGFGPLSVVGGVRVENTNATYRTIDQSATHKYTNFFPDIDFRYSPSSDLVFHAGFSTAIGRPGFQQLSAARSIDLANQLVVAGNPNLKPTLAKNFDGSAEYYTSHGGVLSVAVFYKDFSNYVISTVQKKVTYPGVAIPVELDSFENVGNAHVYGVEVDAKQQFSFLPGGWSGFGVEGNLTWVHSRGAVHQDSNTLALQYGQLPQTSPLAANASLFYDKFGIHAKVAGSYVSRNLWAVGGSTATDIYSQPRFRLDASASIDINPEMSFFVEAKNLTNTKLKFTQTTDANFPIQREYYKPDYLAGVRIRLGH